jgi:hypothetical protein
MVLIDWDSVAYPYLDELTPTLDAVIQRAKSEAVTMTMCDGEVIYQDGKFTKVDRTMALKALHDDLSKALADDEVERRKLSVALLPHVPQVLRELHRHLEAPAVLPAELDGVAIRQTRGILPARSAGRCRGNPRRRAHGPRYRCGP